MSYVIVLSVVKKNCKNLHCFPENEKNMSKWDENLRLFSFHKQPIQYKCVFNVTSVDDSNCTGSNKSVSF